MRAVQLNGFGGADVLEVGDVPEVQPAPGEVLIEVHAAGVNRPDIMQREGKYPPPPGASPRLGLEVAGIIREVRGEGPLAVGDAVCALVPGGGYAEYCTAPMGHCLPIPRGVSMIEAAGIPETYFTVWANLFQLGHLKRGERLLVHGGSSGIGTTAIQLARALGAEVAATAGSEKKVEACRALGATLAVNYRTQDFEHEIVNWTEQRGVDVVLDMVGGDYTPKNVNCLAPGGRLVQIATLRGHKVTLNLLQVMQKRLTLTGSTMRPRSIEEKADIARELFMNVWPLFESNQLRVVVDRVFPLAEVRAAHEHLEQGAVIGKVILQVR